MPIYEYECSNCHHRLDLMQKISDPPVQLCPQCSGNTLVRLVSAAGFQLKGQGWYATDFKNKNTKANQSNVTKEEQSSSVQSTDKPSETADSTKKKTQEGEKN